MVGLFCDLEGGKRMEFIGNILVLHAYSLTMTTLIWGFIFCIPLWIIFKKAGLQPYLSLSNFIPIVGPLIAASLLAFINWPNLKNTRKR